MKGLKYLLSVLASVAVYVAISMTCGSNGIWAMNQLSEQRRIISVNTQEIQNINEGLKLEKTAIQSDKDVIAAYARKLGFVFEDEKIVKISGLKSTPDMKYETGTVLKSKEVCSISESICKASGLLVGFLVFLLMFLYDISKGNVSFKQKKYEVVAGIPIYEVTQI